MGPGCSGEVSSAAAAAVLAHGPVCGRAPGPGPLGSCGPRPRTNPRRYLRTCSASTTSATEFWLPEFDFGSPNFVSAPRIWFPLPEFDFGSPNLILAPRILCPPRIFLSPNFLAPRIRPPNLSPNSSPEFVEPRQEEHHGIIKTD